MSVLKKVLASGMMETHGVGWELHPLSSRVLAVVSTVTGQAYLTDGERRVYFASLANAIEDRETFRRLTFGELLAVA